MSEWDCETHGCRPINGYCRYCEVSADGTHDKPASPPSPRRCPTGCYFNADDGSECVNCANTDRQYAAPLPSPVKTCMAPVGYQGGYPYCSLDKDHGGDEHIAHEAHDHTREIIGRSKKMKDDQIKHMVDRFLGWTLPESFSPDGGISFKKIRNEHSACPAKNEPVGTNLLDAVQAEQMVRYMVEGINTLISQEERDEAVGKGQDETLAETFCCPNCSAFPCLESCKYATLPVGKAGGESAEEAWKRGFYAGNRGPYFTIAPPYVAPKRPI